MEGEREGGREGGREGETDRTHWGRVTKKVVHMFTCVYTTQYYICTCTCRSIGLYKRSYLATGRVESKIPYQATSLSQACFGMRL